MSVQTVELPPGVEHYDTVCFARSWAAYDALTPASGWRQERAWRTGNPGHIWKMAVIRGHQLTVHPPLDSRRVACPDCDGQGRQNPSPRHDPQAEVDCPTCRGDGELAA